MDVKYLGMMAAALVVAMSAAYGASPSPEFLKTEDSDEWVGHHFKVQTEYARVLVVTEGEAPEQVAVTPPDLSGRLVSDEVRRQKPAAAYKTLQEAADAAEGGDLVAVMPGTYAGFLLAEKASCGDGKFIHFKAYGKPGEVTIDRPAEGKDRNWMVNFEAAHHAILEGFNIAGATGPGLEQKGPQSGIFINGNFGNTGKLAHHIAIVNNFSHNHRGWGLHSTDTHTVLMQGNLFALSAREHSAYVSDGSDNYCIRRNVFFASRCSGLQCNLDPEASLNELLTHPAMAQWKEIEKTQEWAREVLAAATKEFGEHNFPDGRGVNFIIEANVINRNGQGGGGSFNFAALQESLIQNNLLYDNLTTGIAEWDNGNPWDAASNDPGPSSPDQVKGPESLAIWGCRRNVVRNNTVVMNVEGRPGMGIGNGSWGNVVRNNVLLNDLYWSLDVSNTSIWMLDSGYNVLNKTTYNDMPDAMAKLAVNIDEKNHSVFSATLEKALPEFVKANNEPWVIIEGNWWRLNPDRPDFHPKAASKLLAGKGDAKNTPAKDIEGVLRSAPDMGAYAAATKD